MKTILIFVDWFEPGFKGGGPIRSVSGFVNNFKDDFKIKIITRNKDHDSSVKYDSVPTNKWVEFDVNVYVFYVEERSYLLTLLKLIRHDNFDWVYLNSFFSLKFSILPSLLFKIGILRANKILIAPRGELKKAALSIKSTKKQIFIKAAKILKIHTNFNWHATSEQEENDIKNLFRPTNILKASNLSKIEIIKSKHIKISNSLRVVFISRIIDYKNLHYAIEVVTKMKNFNSTIFDIYGPIENEKYFEFCFRLASKSKVKITYKGEIPHHLVGATFSEYDVFLFPTLGENYGHVIAEALMAGCIVITSDQTPWSNLEANNVGWSLPLTKQSLFAEKLNYLYALDEEIFKKTKKNVISFALANINSKSTIEIYSNFLK